jgi:hypothetical protein
LVCLLLSVDLATSTTPWATSTTTMVMLLLERPPQS